MPPITRKKGAGTYRGSDPVDGPASNFTLEEGESREVSQDKYDQLKRDFPDQFDFGSGAKRKAAPKAKSAGKRTGGASPGDEES